MADPNGKVRVLIVEDHSIVRWALRHFLETRGIHTTGEAVTIQEAAALADSLQPDIILMDLLLGTESRMQTIRQLASDGYRVLAFSAYDSQAQIEEFLDAGGAGFVSKCSSIEELIPAIDAIAKDQTWISPKIQCLLDQSVRQGKLSRREREIVRLVAKGLSSREIAEQLFVSLKTIETHRYRIFKKLSISTRAQLVNYAIEHGFLNS